MPFEPTDLAPGPAAPEQNIDFREFEVTTSKFEQLQNVDFQDYWQAYGSLYPREHDRARENDRNYKEQHEELFGEDAEPRAERVLVWYRRSGAFNSMRGAQEDLVRGSNIIVDELEAKPDLATPELRLEAASMMLEASRLTEDPEAKKERALAAREMLQQIVGDRWVSWSNETKVDAQMYLMDMDYDAWAQKKGSESAYGALLLKDIETFAQLASIKDPQQRPSQGKLFELYTTINLRHMLYTREETDTVQVRKSYTREDSEISNNLKHNAELSLSDNFDIVVTRKKGDKTIMVPMQLKNSADNSRRYRKPIVVHAERLRPDEMLKHLRADANNLMSVKNPDLQISEAELSLVGRDVEVLATEVGLLQERQPQVQR